MSDKEVAVVGIPRGGTTFLFRSIAGLPPGNTTPKGAAYKSLPWLKSHSLAPPEDFGDQHAADLKKHTDAGGKVIFVFGEPMPAVISTRLKRWDWMHAWNCGFDPDKFKAKAPDIYSKDCFNYERMFDTWMRPHDYPVLAVKYETMSEHFQEIEEFLGRKVDWNEWLQRDRTINCQRVTRVQRTLIAKTYASLTKKWEEAPEIWNWGDDKDEEDLSDTRGWPRDSLRVEADEGTTQDVDEARRDLRDGPESGRFPTEEGREELGQEDRRQGPGPPDRSGQDH